ncbi:hypothetical protein XELAEV_18005696mg [Xenopus laevis]|uniref:AIG1-type G domain-containing protein n=1 Tax=Xenopus laevis TaxID=8355 RepID=A0A974DZR8_XENLA|nr:hypothetical protein XELAEV_18005696mg [Xenopus laevis]
MLQTPIMDDANEITINLLLLGRSKSGKSSLGNSLLGSCEFESQFFPQSVTSECQLCRTCIPQFGRRMGQDLCLRLSLSQGEVKQRVRKVLAEQFSEGLHMALLILRADIPFCEEENQHSVKLEEQNLHKRYIFREPQNKTPRQEREVLTQEILHYVRQNSYQQLQCT